MRALIWITLTLGFVWCGYWFVGKSAVEHTTETVISSLADDGITVATSGHGVAGFPNRFDLTFNDLIVTDQATGFEWRAPFFQIFSLSYKPWHIIAAFAPEQTIAGLKVLSDKMQASLVLTPNPDLPLNRTTLIGETVSILAGNGVKITAETVRFATRQTVEDGSAHQIGMDLLSIALPSAPTGFSNLVERVHLDAIAEFSSPLDRFAGISRPKMVHLTLTEAALNWGDLSLSVSGEVSAKTGLAQGKLTVRAENWRKLIPLIRATGSVDPQILQNIESSMAPFSITTQGVEVLRVPITVADGQMKLGFIPLGPFPLMN